MYYLPLCPALQYIARLLRPSLAIMGKKKKRPEGINTPFRPSPECSAHIIFGKHRHAQQEKPRCILFALKNNKPEPAPDHICIMVSSKEKNLQGYSRNFISIFNRLPNLDWALQFQLCLQHLNATLKNFLLRPCYSP